MLRVVSSRFLANQLRSFATYSPAMREIKQMTVFGAGLMGAGIVQVSAQNGIKVVMTDVSDAALENGKSIIAKSIARIAKKAFPDSTSKQEELIAQTFANITTTTAAAEAIKDADLVIEAIVENLGTKQELFKRLDEIAKPHTIFASNTSSLSISKIAEKVSADRQTKFCGAHYFNPVPAMKLVEVISTDKTSAETTEAILELCKKSKKTPVKCKDTPGFIVNRLLVPYLLEAIRMLERGEATAEDIDIAMKLGAGLPMGPLELSDFVGLDTLNAIAGGWREERVTTGEIDQSAVEPIQLLNQLVKEGKKGRKSGQGFFEY